MTSVQKAEQALAALEAERAELVAESQRLSTALGGSAPPANREEARAQVDELRHLADESAAVERLISALDGRIASARVAVEEAQEARRLETIAKLQRAEEKAVTAVQEGIAVVMGPLDSLRDIQTELGSMGVPLHVRLNELRHALTAASARIEVAGSERPTKEDRQRKFLVGQLDETERKLKRLRASGDESDRVAGFVRSAEATRDVYRAQLAQLEEA